MERLILQKLWSKLKNMCAEAELKTSKTFEEFEQKMLKNYPNHGGKTLLHANSMFLKF